jgi:long-chain fatty acid transport protein
VSTRAALVAAASLAVLAGDVRAGGMQLPTRGVRPTARGGAFVAGADDLGALWFNPAGLAAMPGAGDAARRCFLFDVGFVRQNVEYTRVDAGNNVQPMVANDAPALPIPTLGVGVALGDDVTIAGGLYAPYLATGRYPEGGAQRYSLVDLSESRLVVVEAAVAYRATDRWRVGVGVQNMIVLLASTLVFSACPGQTVCAPEDPEFDAVGKVQLLDAFNPSGVVGVQYAASRALRVGASFQLPFHVTGTGSFATRLPPSGFFDGTAVVGDRADVRFWLPPVLRVGVEVRPTPHWRAELAATVEFWSVHDRFEIVPRDVRIEGVPGVGRYEIGPMEIPRHYGDSVSVHAGVEGKPLPRAPLTVLLGYSYETAAAPDAYLTVLTVDAAKHLVAGGLGVRAGDWDVNATVAVVSLDDRDVDPAEGMSPQITPVRDDPEDPTPLRTYVNWGRYASSWLVAGVGVSTTF